MAKLLIVLAIALLFEATGVIFLSKGLKEVGSIQAGTWSEIGRFSLGAVKSPVVLLGVLFEAIFFAGLLYLMSESDVSFIWPLTSLGFVLTTVAAKIFLGEEIPWARWLGVVFIMIGAGLISWTEQVQQQTETTPGTSMTAGE